jgi:hypothetical protein
MGWQEGNMGVIEDLSMAFGVPWDPSEDPEVATIAGFAGEFGSGLAMVLFEDSHQPVWVQSGYGMRQLFAMAESEGFDTPVGMRVGFHRDVMGVLIGVTPIPEDQSDEDYLAEYRQTIAEMRGPSDPLAVLLAARDQGVSYAADYAESMGLEAAREEPDWITEFRKQYPDRVSDYVAPQDPPGLTPEEAQEWFSPDDRPDWDDD